MNSFEGKWRQTKYVYIKLLHSLPSHFAHSFIENGKWKENTQKRKSQLWQYKIPNKWQPAAHKIPLLFKWWDNPPDGWHLNSVSLLMEKAITLSTNYLAPKIVEFGLSWQQFGTTIICHLTAILTNNTSDLLYFCTEYKKKLAKAWKTGTEVPI